MAKKPSSMNCNTKVDVKRSAPLDPASRIRIVGEGRDEWDQRYFKIEVKGNESKIPPMKATRIIDDPKSLFGPLTNAGCNLFTPGAKEGVIKGLQRWKPTGQSFKVATRLGWNSGAFILPSGEIGQPSQPLEMMLNDLDPAMRQKYRVKGTSKEWNAGIAKLCAGNTRLMFSVSLALTGPILPFVRGPKAGGFQIFGPAESGKTTAAMVAGTVWGCHAGEGRRERGFAEFLEHDSRQSRSHRTRA